MRQKLVITILTLSLWIPLTAFATSGLINTKSEEGNVKVVANRVEADLKEKGLNLVIRIDHTQNAKKADLELSNNK